MAATTIVTQSPPIAAPPQVMTQVPGNVLQVAPEPPHPAASNKRIFTAVGIIQITAGFLSVILGGVSLGVYYWAYYAGYGLWSGAWYIASGSLALATGARPNRCNVIAGMIISILACLTAFGVGIAESVLTAAWSLCYGYHCPTMPTSYIGVHGTLAFLSFVEFITAIVHSGLCCAGTCCAGNTQQGQVLTTTTTYMNVPAGQVQMQQPYAQPQYYPQQQTPQQPQMYPNYPAQQQQGMRAPPPTYVADTQKQPL